MVGFVNGPEDPLWEATVNGYRCKVYQEISGTLVGELARPDGALVQRIRVSGGRAWQELQREVEQVAVMLAAPAP